MRRDAPIAIPDDAALDAESAARVVREAGMLGVWRARLAESDAHMECFEAWSPARCWCADSSTTRRAGSRLRSIARRRSSA